MKKQFPRTDVRGVAMALALAGLFGSANLVASSGVEPSGRATYDPLLDDPGQCVRPSRRRTSALASEADPRADRDQALQAAADAGRGRRRAAVRQPGHAVLQGGNAQREGAGLLRPGHALGLRVQPRRGATRLPGRAEGRPEARDGLVGRGAGARAEHQRADDARGGCAGAGRACQGSRTGARRAGEGSCVDRGSAEALLGGPEGRARRARRGLRRRDEVRGREVSARRHDPRALRRVRDGHAGLGLLGGGGRETQGPRRRDARCAGDGARTQSETPGSDPSLHPRGRGVDEARARAAARATAGRVDAGCGPRRAHAGPHLLPRRHVQGVAGHQQACDGRRRAVLQAPRPRTRCTSRPTTRTTSTSCWSRRRWAATARPRSMPPPSSTRRCPTRWSRSSRCWNRSRPRRTSRTRSSARPKRSSP